VRFGNAVAAGTAAVHFYSRKTVSRRAEKVMFPDKIAPFEPLAPMQYRIHVDLFSRYATELNKPVQELVQKVSIVP